MKYQHETIQVETPAPGHYIISGHSPRPVMTDAGHLVPSPSVHITPEVPNDLLVAILEDRGFVFPVKHSEPVVESEPLEDVEPEDVLKLPYNDLLTYAKEKLGISFKVKPSKDVLSQAVEEKLQAMANEGGVE